MLNVVTTFWRDRFMTVFCVCGYEYMSYARGLLGSIKNIDSVLPECSGQRIEIVRENIESADIIVVVVDKSFNEKEYLRREVKIAVGSMIKNDAKIIVPIVIGDAKMPEELSGTGYLLCDFSSKDEIDNTKKALQEIIEERYGNGRKKKVLKNNLFSIMSMTMVLGIVAMLFLYLMLGNNLWMDYYSQRFSEFALIIMLLIIMLSALIFFISYLSFMQRRKQEYNVKQQKRYSDRLRNAFFAENDLIYECKGEDEKQKEIDALKRMMINLEDINEFYTWSQKQAKSSFWLAVYICVIGVVLMVGASVAMLIFKLSLEVSIIVAIGGAITEVVAGTALVVYRSSLIQLNHYHRALHEDERFLSSVNLVGRFNSVEMQDEMMKEIIRSELEMNLLGMTKMEQEIGCKKKGSN